MKYLILIMCIFMGGCSVNTTHIPGTVQWHEVRYQEIQESYDNKEITKAEMLSLKTEADQVRATRLNDNSGVKYHFNSDGTTGYSY